ncbi:DUF5753 domain-containing protein [Streptomyces sp. NPDC006173]|uniref:DUF5753 domain-containing protein n=1 Tax=Streptomyces sp. NPDC006173 TaxID=3155349 RepID=UPI0033D49DE2
MTTPWESPAESLGEHIERLAAIEAEADSVQMWEPMLIPGLLQSYAYAAAAITSLAPALPLDVVEQRADQRRHRIDQLGCPGQRSITVAIDESALYRPVGGYLVLAEQLERLTSLAALQPSLTLRVLPQSSQAHPGLSGAFALYRASGRRAVFTETLTGSTVSTRPEDVAAYASAWDRLLTLALPPKESMHLIESVRGSLCRSGKTMG